MSDDSNITGDEQPVVILNNDYFLVARKHIREAAAFTGNTNAALEAALVSVRQLNVAYEQVKSEQTALRRENSRKAIEHSQSRALIERMKEAFGVLYQVLGQVGAPERILDLANNAANGEIPLEVSDVLPVRAEEFDSALRVYNAPSHIRQVHVEQPGVWTFVPDAPSIETGEPL